MTFLLEGGSASGGRCPYALNTVFDASTLSVNVGERHPAVVVSGSDASFTHGEGGLAYVDISIGSGGGGGGGRK